jgi:hypothetical protein
MSFEAFWNVINKLIPGNPLRGKETELARLNPDKIYLENVRSVLGVSSPMARRICETAVRQGTFQKMIEVACPDGSIAASAENETELPPFVTCWSENHGDVEPIEIASESLPKAIFYRLNG